MSHYPFYQHVLSMPHEDTITSPVLLTPQAATDCYQAAKGLAGLLLMLSNDDTQQHDLQQGEEGAWVLSQESRHALHASAAVLCRVVLNRLGSKEHHASPTVLQGLLNDPQPSHDIPVNHSTMARWFGALLSLESVINLWPDSTGKAYVGQLLSTWIASSQRVIHYQLHTLLELEQITQDTQTLLQELPQHLLGAKQITSLFSALLPMLQSLDMLHQMAENMADNRRSY